MEGVLRQLYAECANNPATKGILFIKGACDVSPDPIDAIFIVVTEQSNIDDVKHFNCSGLKVVLYIVTESELLHDFSFEKNRKMMEWISQGEILLNKNGVLTDLRERLCRITTENRRKKIGTEFSRLLGRFEDGKKRYTQGYYLDAFTHFQEALHHLARFSILEKEIYLGVHLWDQVKEVDPETYKLYEELTVGEEDVQKRLELLIIALEFTVRSKMDKGVEHILNIMKNGKEAWSYSDLLHSRALLEYAPDLEVLLHYLVENEYVMKIEESFYIPGIFEYKYLFKN